MKKKKIYILLFSILMALTFCIHVSATVGSDSYGTNLLNSSDKSSVNVMIDPSSEGLAANFYNVDLSPSTTYTFISTQALDEVIIAPSVNGYVYAFDSYNLAYRNSQSFNSTTSGYVNWIFSENVEEGSYHISFDISSNISSNYLFFLSGSNGVKVLKSGSYSSGDTSVSFDIDISSSDIASSGTTLYFRPFNVSSLGTVSVVVDSIELFISSVSDVYVPVYSEIFSSNGTVYTFTTPESLSNPYVLGFIQNGVPTGAEGDVNIFLVEGVVNVHTISNTQKDTWFNTGYTEGYSTGQTDGLESSNALGNIIFTILSAPFVIISNSLDFEILGINILNLVKVILTLLIVAFAITKLKGRE